MSRTQYAPLLKTYLPDIPVSSLVFTAFDFETTGLDYRTERITEIGAVKFSTDGGVIDEFATMIDPQCRISEEAARVTGITDEMCRGMPLIAEKIPPLFDFFSDTWLIAHHALFDASFLLQACAAAEAPCPSNIILDTRLIAKQVYPSQPGYSLERLASFLHITPPRHHRALDDAHTCMNIFLSCVKQKGGNARLRDLTPTGFRLES